MSFIGSQMKMKLIFSSNALACSAFRRLSLMGPLVELLRVASMHLRSTTIRWLPSLRHLMHAILQCFFLQIVVIAFQTGVILDGMFCSTHGSYKYKEWVINVHPGRAFSDQS